MLQERDSCFFSLAAGWVRLCLVLLCLGWLPVAQASLPLSPDPLIWPTSPLETRVGGCAAKPSGRLFPESLPKLTIAPTCDESAYEIVSGRRQWPNRDPLGIEGGINLYAYVGNGPVNAIDPWGMVLMDFSFHDKTADRYGLLYLPPQLVKKLTGANPDNYLKDYNIVQFDSVDVLSAWMQADNENPDFEGFEPIKAKGLGASQEEIVAAQRLMKTMLKIGLVGSATAVLGSAALMMTDIPIGASAEGLPVVSKAVNSQLQHAVSRAIERGAFADKRAAADALRALSKQITANGWPENAILDTARADSVLVPVGNNGMAVYRVLKNGTAVLRTVLIGH